MVAGAIYYGLLDNDTTNFPMPTGELVKEKACNYVYDKTGAEFRLLMKTIIMAIEPPNHLPLAGGVLDQPPIFLDLLTIFKNSRQQFDNIKQKNIDILKTLGAK